MFKTINILFRTAFGGAIITSIYIGWGVREKHYLTAEEGLGYGLGILGGVMMLILLLYPARKNLRFMKNMLPVRYWFRLHMLLGILGPVMIIFHSGFYLGSINSTVALFSMLIVASSGLFGRYFYSKIHHGLYGQKKTLDELILATVQGRNNLQDVLEFEPDLSTRVDVLNKLVNDPDHTLGSSSLLRSLGYSRKANILSKKFKKIARRTIRKMHTEPQVIASLTRKEIKQKKKMHLTEINTYVSAVQKKAEFTVYDKLFALWHVLHVPLFILLVITSLFHVYAVHVY